MGDTSEKSMYGWTEEFPPRFDEDPNVQLDPALFPLQVNMAAVLFDTVHRDSMTSADHDEILWGALENQPTEEWVALLGGFIRLLCGALATAGANPSDPGSEYRALIAAFAAVENEERRFQSQ